MNAAKRTKRVALYVRVSTDHQTIKNQERELEAVAERHGWQVVAIFRGPKAATSDRGSTS